MAQSTTLSTIFFLFVYFLTSVSSLQQLGDVCTKSIQCETNYCRDGRCINFGDSPDDVGAHPCAVVLCLAPSDCILEQVQCIRSPCPPAARCVRPRLQC